ncbi:MAG: hypothetical protein PHN47_08460 [Clostridia bacterium]|nr:hypothetical protein [Clostridia bacterium]
MDIVNIDNLLERGYLDSVMQNGGTDVIIGQQNGEMHIGYESFIKGELFYIIDNEESMIILFEGENNKIKYEFNKKMKVFYKNSEQLNTDNGIILYKRILKEFEDKNKKTVTIKIKEG